MTDQPPGATVVSPAVAAAAEDRDLLTLGVEEEYLLVDPDRPYGVGAVDDVVARLADDVRPSVQHEYVSSQLEVASPPQLELAALRTALSRLRRGVADACGRAGVRLAAVGASPGAGPPAPLTDDPRYHRMQARFGDLAAGHGLNGTHVHVSVPDPETGVRVLDHLRPWLPVLQAATGNSPFYEGVDTRYASWRSMMWERWPTVGPTPYLGDLRTYESLVADLESTGAMLDEGMLYWYARLSARYPTVELRMGDVCPTVDDVLLLAALARALVATVLADVRAGRPAPRVPDALLVAAHWRAAREGLEGDAVDPVNRRTVPAWRRMRELFDLVRPELERHGDLETATLLMGRLRAHGTGAARQRAVLAGGGSLEDVMAWLVAATRGDTGPAGATPPAA